MTLMEETKIDFANLPLVEPGPGVRWRGTVGDGKRLRVAEFDRVFVEREWCTKGHAAYVLQGEVELVFADRTVRFYQGDGILIADGESRKHKLRVLSERATLFIVDL